MTFSTHGLLILVGAATVAAGGPGQHIADSPFLNQFVGDSGYITISTAGSGASHTTYIAKCDNSGANACTLPSAGATIVTGPSYVGCSYTDPSGPLVSSVGCTYINAGSSALCTIYQSGQSGTNVVTMSQTESVPAWAVALGFDTPITTGPNAKQTSEASAGNTAAMTTGAATSTDSGVLSTKASTTNQNASKTSSATTTTKTGGAARGLNLGNMAVAVGAAIIVGLTAVI